MSLKIQQKMLKIVTVLLLLFFNLTFSQNYWNKAPYIGSGGVIEIGKYIDFHEISADQSDYSVRLYSDNGVLTSNRSMNINGEVRTKTLVVDDPIRVTNWNELWQSGFYESHEATNAPEPYNWFWGVVMNHSTDNPAYKYSGQIAIKNGYDKPVMYFRSTNKEGEGVWAKVLHNTGNQAIKGKLEAKEIKVTTTPTADFVFEDNYKIPSLEEVEDFIKKNKHLPEITSAEEMKKNGVNVGDFQIKLLQKIEELTLYVIEQEKRIKKYEDLEERVIMLENLK